MNPLSRKIKPPSGNSFLFPILGEPVGHLRSPELLSLSFDGRNIDAFCIPMEVSENSLESAVHGLSCIANVAGMLITMPHKSTAIRSCSTLSARARLMGSVSVIRRNPDQSWHGDQLDGKAMVTAMMNNGAQVRGARALLVGLGGAGRAIALELLEQGARELVIAEKDSATIGRFVEALPAKDQERILVAASPNKDFDIVCNATPLGMNDRDPLPCAPEFLARSAHVADVVSGHGVTPLIEAARARGCSFTSGDQMVEAVQEEMLTFFGTGVGW